MSELSDLYQEVILDHHKRPRNYQELPAANRKAEGYNPLCGDQLTLFLQLDGDVVTDVGFVGSGCAISRASASLMTTAVKGKTVAEVQSLFRNFHEMVTTDVDPDPERLGKLAVFAGVREFPARVKCASLAWHTLQAALHGDEQPVRTE